MRMAILYNIKSDVNSFTFLIFSCYPILLCCHRVSAAVAGKKSCALFTKKCQVEIYLSFDHAKKRSSRRRRRHRSLVKLGFSSSGTSRSSSSSKGNNNSNKQSSLRYCTWCIRQREKSLKLKLKLVLTCAHASAPWPEQTHKSSGRSLEGDTVGILKIKLRHRYP